MTTPSSTNADLLWKGRNRDGWNQGGRYQYGNESLSIAEISERSGQCETKVRQYIRKFSWSLEKFFAHFGDTGPVDKIVESHNPKFDKNDESRTQQQRTLHDLR